MPSKEDKNALLNQLKITEEETTDSGLTTMHLLLTSVLSAVITGLVVYLLISPNSGIEIQTNDNKKLIFEQGKSSNQVLNSTSKNTNTAEVKTSKQFQFSNSEEVLNASGYITARRIATVSAETMGLITSVRVEEGMLVKTGQILATLDSSIATVNLKLFDARTDVLRSSVTSISIDLLCTKRVKSCNVHS